MQLNQYKLDLALARRGWWPQDLAAKVGVHPVRIHAIRRNRRIRPKTLYKIAKALGVDVETLIEPELKGAAV